MEAVIKPLLITIWLFALLYFGIPKKEELIEQYVINSMDSLRTVDKSIKMYSILLIFNAVLVVIYGLDQIISYPYSNNQLTGIILLMTGLVLCLAAYGIWNKYSWGRTMTPLVLIIVTILVISTTHLNNDLDNPLMDSTNSISIDLQPYFNPITLADMVAYFIKIGYFAILSVASIRFLEKPGIKAIISR